MFPYLLLAPMAGYTTSNVRFFFRRNGADMVFTEMVSAKALVINNKKTFNLAEFAEEERPIGVQLFGGDPYVLSDAACLLQEKFKPDVIDINMGCPVKKIISQGYGAALLNKRELALKIAEKVSEAVSIPVSVKTRIGFDRPLDKKFFEELGNTGISFITIHGRTAKSLFSGSVNWDFIFSVAEVSPIPVFGNGGLLTSDDIRDKLKKGLYGAMIGIGALRDPYIFLKARNIKFQNKPSYFLEFIAERGESIHIVKRFALNMLKSRHGVRRVKSRVAVSKDVNEIINLVKGCLDV